MLKPYHRILFIMGLVLLWCMMPTSVRAQSTDQGRTATINGAQIYYETYGEGTPLLLIHGAFASGKVWRPYVADFAKHFRVIVVDMRGNGHSTNPANEWTFRQSAEDIFSLMDELHIKTFNAIGASAGAMTLIHMATQQPERLEAIILVRGTQYLTSDKKGIGPADSLKKGDYEWMRQYAAFGDKQIRALSDQLFNMDVSKEMNFKPSQLSVIKARTLIVHGDHDSIFPVERALEMYRAIPGSYLWVVPNSEHGPQDSRPEVFKQWAIEFLLGKWDKKCGMDLRAKKRESITAV